MYSISNIGELLKIIYGPIIQRTIPEEVTLLNFFKENTDRVWNNGSYYTEPVDLLRDSSEGYRAGEGTGALLPVDTDVTLQQMRTVYVKTAYGKVKFSRKIMEMTKNAPGQNAFANIVKDRMDKITNDCANTTDIHLYGDGTGVLALVSGNQAGATVLCKNSAGFWQDGKPRGAVRYFEEGESVQFLNGAGVVQATKRITAVDHVNNTITFVGAIGVTDGWFIVRGDANGNEYNRTPEGLYSVFNSNPYHGINRTTYPRWATKTFGNSGALRPMAIGLMQQIVDYPANVGQGKGPDFLLAHSSLKGEYTKIVEGDLRYTNLNMIFKRGVKKLIWTNGDEDIPFIFSRNCPYHVLFALKSDSFEWSVLSDWHWVEHDGSIMKWAGSDSDNYLAYMATDSNLACTMPNKNVILTDIEVDPTSMHA